MILVINICKEKLHSYEFVKPVEDILQENGMKYFVRHYREISDGDLKKADKIIICGTSLFDNEFSKDIKKFNWLKDFDKPVLGICGGMQIIGMIFGGKLNKKTEIGFYMEKFSREFLGLKGEREVYHLHNNHVLFSQEFKIYSKSNGIIQAIKHKKKEIYGMLKMLLLKKLEVLKKDWGIHKEEAL